MSEIKNEIITIIRKLLNEIVDNIEQIWIWTVSCLDERIKNSNLKKFDKETYFNIENSSKIDVIEKIKIILDYTLNLKKSDRNLNKLYNILKDFDD